MEPWPRHAEVSREIHQHTARHSARECLLLFLLSAGMEPAREGGGVVGTSAHRAALSLLALRTCVLQGQCPVSGKMRARDSTNICCGQYVRSPCPARGAINMLSSDESPQKLPSLSHGDGDSGSDDDEGGELPTIMQWCRIPCGVARFPLGYGK